MDSLPALGTNIGQTVPGTVAVYTPLLLANEAAIRSTAPKTFVYGPEPRHQLDVYYPQENPTSSPIFVFVHGGGFVGGSKTLPLGGGLAYANLGHFFASKYGFTVVIPDYRLMSHGAKYPSGGEDVGLVVEWIAKELAPPGGSPRELFIMGNSVGGVHTDTFAFAPDFKATRLKVTEQAAHTGIRLSAVVDLSAPYDFEGQDEYRIETTTTYYGKDIDSLAPTGLLRQINPHANELKDVRWLVVSTEYDSPAEILGPRERYLEAWKEPKPDTKWVEGHNHISPVLGLGTGIQREEKWGHQVGDWLVAKS